MKKKNLRFFLQQHPLNVDGFHLLCSATFVINKILKFYALTHSDVLVTSLRTTQLGPD